MLRPRRLCLWNGLCTSLSLRPRIVDGTDIELQTENFAGRGDTGTRCRFAAEIFHWQTPPAVVVSRPSRPGALVRPGLALYGSQLPLQRRGDLQPKPAHARLAGPVTLLEPCARRSRMPSGPGKAARLRGTFFPLSSPSLIAVLPLGYAMVLCAAFESWPRHVRDHYAPIVGRFPWTHLSIDRHPRCGLWE